VAHPCTVCTHPDRAKIDEVLVSGTAIRDIAGQHARTATALILGRHWYRLHSARPSSKMILATIC
jgi:hypothetical protein